MTNVKLPIKTVREGNKITKVCVEDVYKMVNRIQNGMNDAFSKTVEIIDSIHKDVETSDGIFEGELIIGTGISQPCLIDAFDEEIGSNIAFIKAKLNANIKKYKFLTKVFKSWEKTLDVIDNEFEKVEKNILMDLKGIRLHNPEYLQDIEYKLGIIINTENEDEEETC